ncbi:MAG TPA: YdeI/OmpD-associated family protein [Candidatus Aminicenantes bacterium]|nr:YdeI/OmpD-associated family protein [Candidatus Aminicenantes bacterium]HRY65560.1 YdeI/OmpD-associated family protein [Candidatus Aminicenantes bacterium]HRZ72552.1 YdeI/OmpD-associated family protein [Candidatus Aminicenantes bacterium]
MPAIDPTRLLNVSKRSEWRAWLRRHYKTSNEVWLVFAKKSSGLPRVAYNDAVEEALAFGWIDSTAKRIDEGRFAQRFTPRQPKSPYSEANLVRLRAMAAGGKVVPEVLEKVRPLLVEKPLVVPPDILAALKADPATWKNYRAFSGSYKRIRIGYIDAARGRPEEFAKRLRSFLRATRANRIVGFGGIQKHY